MSPTRLPRRCARRPRRTLRSHDRHQKFKTRPRAKRGRGERYARTIVNAHHVNQACMLSPCARLVRIMSPTVLPGATRGGRGVRYVRKIAFETYLNNSSGERGPRRALRSHDIQRASRNLSVHAAALCSPCAHHAPPILPRPRFTLRSQDYQRASHKLSFQNISKRGLGRRRPRGTGHFPINSTKTI
jgi:hypothetical protein